MRVLGSLGRVEAFRLGRHPIVLAGVVGAVVLLVAQTRGSVARWWVADVHLGTALLFVGVAVLYAGYLATARAVRDGLADLYESFPTSATKRIGAHLVALMAPVVASAAFVVIAVGWLDAQGAIGSPRVSVLAGGLALVALLGALGVALGRWAPGPWAGLFAATLIALVEVDVVVPSFDGPVRLGRALDWVLPWHQPFVSGEFPGPIASFPPATAHLVELVGLAALTSLAALASRAMGVRRLFATATAACLAAGAVGWAGWSETRPIPVGRLDSLVAAAIHPATHERCQTRAGVSYCAYPAYLPWVRLWAAPVDGVLSRLPRRPARRLVVRQVVDSSFLCSPSLGAAAAASCTGGTPSGPRGRQVARLASRLTAFQAALSTDAALVPGSARPPVYVGLNWGSGATLGPAELNLALDVAYWAVHLPTTGQVVHAQGGTQQVSCLPVGQAREAIAVWLAASATPATRAALRAEVSAGQIGSVPYGNGRSSVATFAASSTLDTVGSLETTGRATLLAAAMTALPERRVEAVLAAHWSTWTNWRTSDKSLATALGLRLPPAPPTPATVPPAAAGSGQVIQVSGPPPSPVCH
ncbi:MAG: hypothetical protein M0010_18425 [Actinomycetota bacterium]|nr:hypothetical protein [Actinomycetota bacterium]